MKYISIVRLHVNDDARILENLTLSRLIIQARNVDSKNFYKNNISI